MSENYDLKIYMGYNKRAGSNEGAVLIYAHSAKEARKLGWPNVKNFIATPWPDMAVRIMRNNLDYLYGDANQKKLKAGTPHVVENMRVCPTCGLWGEDGGKPDEHGLCNYCREDKESVIEERRHFERREGDRRAA